ncbi:hypothetical protein RclHR1_06410005 [Rhizophagus clarus]|uniref:Uncharacterized protein n=1 Tax=Rhizophagus clarus TaxID=94130 RepID=A0A2Z6RRM7_9GLOM|nr:hypothetical protein RclHR1_06410005 [Rhizophagus clarus]GES87969.1 hypothetical protein RCL_e23063_RclHR1_06410005 [Rhizophagus clarus]
MTILLNYGRRILVIQGDTKPGCRGFIKNLDEIIEDSKKHLFTLSNEYKVDWQATNKWFLSSTDNNPCSQRNDCLKSRTSATIYRWRTSNKEIILARVRNVIHDLTTTHTGVSATTPFECLCSC